MAKEAENIRPLSARISETPLGGGDQRAASVLQSLRERRVERRVPVLGVDPRLRHDRGQRRLAAQVEAAGRRAEERGEDERGAAHHTTTFTSFPGT